MLIVTPRRPRHGCALTSLPAELQLAICAVCGEVDLLALSGCCRSLRSLVDDGSLWEPLIRRRHSRVIAALFDGVVPSPGGGRAWTHHAFAFDREWLDMARQRSGRVLLRMSANCIARRPSHLGVPSVFPKWLYVRVPGFGELALKNLFGLHAAPPRFGVFDVTDFVDQHPGADQILLDAACLGDCTLEFDASNHTERARSILRKLAIPGVAALPPLPPLARPRRGKVAHATSRVVQELRAMLLLVCQNLVLAWCVLVERLRERSCSAACWWWHAPTDELTASSSPPKFMHTFCGRAREPSGHSTCKG